MNPASKKTLIRELSVAGLLDTLTVAVVFVLVARVWPINSHLVFLIVLAGLAVYILWRRPVKLAANLASYIPLGLMGIVFGVMASSSLWAPELWRTFSYSVFSFLHFLIGLAVAVAFR